MFEETPQGTKSMIDLATKKGMLVKVIKYQEIVMDDLENVWINIKDQEPPIGDKQ